jgi:hypothetical protein
MVTDPLDSAKRKEHEVSRTDIDEVASGQGSLGRDTYSIYYLPKSSYEDQHTETGGDAIFDWVLWTFK